MARFKEQTILKSLKDYRHPFHCCEIAPSLIPHTHKRFMLTKGEHKMYASGVGFI